MSETPAAVRTRVRTRRRPPLPLTAAAVTVVGLTLLPLVYLVVRATSGGREAWSVLTRRGTAELLLDTGVLVATVTVAAVVLGVALAWLVTRTDIPGRRTLGIAAALPLVIPSYVAALALLGAFGPRGLLQQLLAGPFGIERIPEIYGFPGAVVALTLSTYPYVYILTAAALRNADPALEEASASLGRSPLATFSRVTIPVVRPAVAAGALLAALYALADFGAVSLMQYTSLTRAIYLQYRSLFDRTPAAILALVLIALTVIVLALEARSRRAGRYHTLGPGAARPPRLVSLGRWRWPAFGAVTLTVLLFLGVPLTVLGYWLERAISLRGPLELPWGPALGSLGTATAAAAAAAVAALPIAILAGRHRTRFTATLERLAYMPNALPGIVIALSLVFFGARYASPVYQTLGLLLFAYVVRFLPEALAGSSSALAAIDPKVEEAARGLGRSRVGVLLTVTLPLARSGILAGAALVFLSTMKELPATLLLRPIGFESLATEIWKETAVGAYSQAALPALSLIALSAPLVLVLVTRGRGIDTAPG
ncbi:MAG: iron ABC transporter permease [Thermoleophilia bacterium]|nr:iron ABC transporter permease [Thermoleophilia bacterium]